MSDTPADNPLRPLVPFTARGGVPNFLAKLKAGGPVKIAYFGGSITEQKGWRVQSLAWFQKRFPQAQLEEIDAAIGGTNSELGVFRVQADVVDARPDLVFVEFAVNDGGSRPENIQRAMEGIVRKIWRGLPDCDICFVYTITAQDVGILQAGRMTRSQSAMEEIADHYGIPSISFGCEVARLQQEGKLIMASPEAHVERVSGDELDQNAGAAGDGKPILFSQDGVHPYLDTGHVIYTQALVRAMEAMDGTGQPGPHVLPAPLMSDNWEAATMVPLDKNVTFQGEASKLDPRVDPLAKQFAGRLPILWKLGPGASLHFRFRGVKACLYGLYGPDGGDLNVLLDGQSRKIASFDPYSTYPRLGLFSIGSDLENKEHEVTITVLPDVLDKRSILLEARRKDFDQNPAKYAGICWYVGSVLIVGDLTPEQGRLGF